MLNIYPEEELRKKPAFAAAIEEGEIEFRTLVAEAGRILILWQMLLLDRPKLEIELRRSETASFLLTTLIQLDPL